MFGSNEKDIFTDYKFTHDEATGFEAKSPTLFFGRKGAEHAKRPYMSLSSSGKDGSCLHISVTDFLILDWCISLAVGDWFDEYGEYHFSYEEWQALLADADRLLSAEDFDALFDELIERQGREDFMLYRLNSRGASFWEERGRYKAQIKDVREWSSLVLGPDDTMHIYGF